MILKPYQRIGYFHIEILFSGFIQQHKYSGGHLQIPVFLWGEIKSFVFCLQMKIDKKKRDPNV